MEVYKRILNYARPISFFAVPYFIVAMLAQLFGLVNFLALFNLLDILFDSTQAPVLSDDAGFIEALKFKYMTLFYEFVKTKGATRALYFICIAAVAGTFLSNTFRYLSLRLLEKLKAKVIKNLRVGLFNKIMSLDLGYFTQKRKGDILSRATNDIYEVEYSVTRSLSSFLKDPLTIIIYFIILFSIFLPDDLVHIDHYPCYRLGH